MFIIYNNFAHSFYIKPASCLKLTDASTALTQFEKETGNKIDFEKMGVVVNGIPQLSELLFSVGICALTGVVEVYRKGSYPKTINSGLKLDGRAKKYRSIDDG